MNSTNIEEVNTLEVNNTTTRSILVIEEEYDARVMLLAALTAENWKVLFALTEEAVESALTEVAGVILDWNIPEIIDRNRILKMIGTLPLLVTSASVDCPHPHFMQKPYTIPDMVMVAGAKFVKDQFYIGDCVESKITPDWGEGSVVGIYPDNFYGIVFKSKADRNSPSIAFKCHFTGLKWITA